MITNKIAKQLNKKKLKVFSLSPPSQLFLITPFFQSPLLISRRQNEREMWKTVEEEEKERRERMKEKRGFLGVNWIFPDQLEVIFKSPFLPPRLHTFLNRSLD